MTQKSTPLQSGVDERESDRFAFGENWKSFLETLDEQRIQQAIRSMKTLLKLDSDSEIPLQGKSFLDIGSGSGLFSLAAHRMGAKVVSLDYDPQSVACTRQLQQQFGNDNWQVHQGSVLDETWLQSLGEFDVVYSWGVLHHTGQLNRAIAAAQQRVASGGVFAIAIYNDQGRASRRWLAIKKLYNRLPKSLRPLWVIMVAGWYEMKFALARLVHRKNPLPFRDWREKKLDRGMSAWHDWVDWIGGLPFEVASPDEITKLLAEAGFDLINLKTVGNGWGCNEYVFHRQPPNV